jgi:hypothetical protein
MVTGAHAKCCHCHWEQSDEQIVHCDLWKLLAQKHTFLHVLCYSKHNQGEEEHMQHLLHENIHWQFRQTQHNDRLRRAFQLYREEQSNAAKEEGQRWQQWHEYTRHF